MAIVDKIQQLLRLILFLFSRAVFIILSFLLFDFTPAYAYEQPTHVEITEQAISQSPNYIAFKSNFEIDGSASIKGGSFDEDKFPRFIHHFYDPTTGQGICPLLCLPSLQWGSKFDGSLFISKNDYSWAKAREYMYIALTGRNFNGDAVAATADERNQYFQLMFRSVGQVMHLVEDLASPAHVRNDPHIPFGLAGDLYEHYVFNHYNSNWATGYPTVQLNQFSDYWNSSRGLAVFTNSNFISQNTNFDDRNIDGNLFYSSPQIQGIITKTEEITDQFGHTVQVQVDYGRNVIQDAYNGDVFTNDRLTAFSVFDFEYQELFGERVYSVNDFTMESAARILVPRAVGYSAGLLDYFFRGDLNTRKDGNDGLRIKNESIEDMDGTFALYYDDKDGMRKPVQNASWRFLLGAKMWSDRLTFTPPADAADPEKYILVFNGQLGVEEQAVVGKNVELKVNYVFIIQETLALNSTPYEEPVNFGPEVILHEETRKIWPAEHQIRTGRFVTHGTIKSIRLLGAQGGLYLDDVNIPSNVWNVGDTPAAPSRWRVEDLGLYQVLEVVLEDDTVIRQGLFSYNGSISSERGKIFERRLCGPDGFDVNCTPDQYTQIIEDDFVGSSTGTLLSMNMGFFDSNRSLVSETVSTVSNFSESLSVPIQDQFHLPQLGGVSPDTRGNPGTFTYVIYGPLTNRYYVYVRRYDTNTTTYHYILGTYVDPATGLTNVIIGSEQTPDPYTYYNSLIVPGYLPFVLPSQIDRVYSQTEMDYLNSLGIQPEQYSIVLQ